MRAFNYRELSAAALVGVLLACGLYGLLAVSDPPESEYTVVDLSALAEGARTEVYGFNSHDGLSGEIRTTEGLTQAFVWDPKEGLTILGTLGGSASYGRGLNDSGQAVGISDLEGTGQRAFLWRREEGLRDLGVLGGDRSKANAITWDGYVLGSSTINATGEEHAFVWNEEEGMRDLGTLGGRMSEVYSRNDRGTLVGWSLPEIQMISHATLWTATGAVQDLGTLGGAAAVAYGIDSRGRVVGKAEKSKNVFRAFLWSPRGGMRDLGTLGGTWSVAYSLSDDGEIFGLSSIEGVGAGGWVADLGRWMTGDSGAGGETHAVIWRDHQPIDVNDLIPPDSGWELFEVYGKNAKGNVLARGSYDGSFRSCYLIPRGATNPFVRDSTRSHDPS